MTTDPAVSLQAVIDVIREGSVKATPEQTAYLRGAADVVRLTTGLQMATPLGGRLESVDNLNALGKTLRQIAETLRTRDRPIEVADCHIDTRSASGQLTVAAIVGATMLTRELIAERTKAALAIKRAEGVRVGRPSSTPPDVVARIVADRHRGLSLERIAQSLNADGIPTPRGGSHWRGSSVKAILVSQDAIVEAHE